MSALSARGVPATLLLKGVSDRKLVEEFSERERDGKGVLDVAPVTLAVLLAEVLTAGREPRLLTLRITT